MKGTNAIRVWAASMALVLLVVSGCSKPVDKPAGAPAEPAEKVTVTMTQWGTDEELESMKAVIAKFNDTHANIKLEMTPLPHGPYYDQLEIQMAGGTAPDIYKAVFSRFGRYAKEGAALELTSLLPQGTKEQFVDAYWRGGTVDGKVYGIPMNTDTLMLFYNVEALKKAGIADPPKNLQDAWTLDQWLDVARKVKAAGVTKYAFTTYGRHQRYFLLLLNQLGGSLLTADGKKANLSAPEGVKAVEWLVNTFKEGLTPPSTIWNKPDDVDTLFAQGLTAMSISGQWMMPFFDKNVKGFSYAVTFLPKGVTAATDLGGGGFMIFSKTKHPKEAAEALLYLTGAEAMGKYVQDNYMVPTREDLKQKGLSYATHAVEMKLFTEQTSVLLPLHVQTITNPNYPQLEQVFKEEIEQAILSKKTPQQATKDADERMNKILAGK